MQRLVEDLLTLSRLESSHNPPREEEIDVPELVRALYHDALALSAGRHRVAARPGGRRLAARRPRKSCAARSAT